MAATTGRGAGTVTRGVDTGALVRAKQWHSSVPRGPVENEFGDRDRQRVRDRLSGGRRASGCRLPRRWRALPRLVTPGGARLRRAGRGRGARRGWQGWRRREGAAARSRRGMGRAGRVVASGGLLAVAAARRVELWTPAGGRRAVSAELPATVACGNSGRHAGAARGAGGVKPAGGCRAQPATQRASSSRHWSLSRSRPMMTIRFVRGSSGSHSRPAVVST